MMTNKEQMRTALRRYTIPHLQKLGFTGRYPHFLREQEGCIDLLSFQTNIYGGSFTVEVSAVFPEHAESNRIHWEGEPEELNVFATNRRYRLPGMYNGWFHYQDIYCRRFLFSTEYLAVPEREADSFIPAKGFRLFRKFDAAQAEQVCLEINRQLEGAWQWLEAFKKEHA